MSLDRRSFIAAGGAALVIAGCGETERSPGGEPVSQDLGIVNFALTLEHLEADFYDRVVRSGVLSGREGRLARMIRDNEHEHVDALTATARKLGGRPATAPATRFEPVLAGGRSRVIATAADLENLGAAAYLGQADAIVDEEVLSSALAIHTVEARHAAILNKLAGREPLPDGAFAEPLHRDEVLTRARRYLA